MKQDMIVILDLGSTENTVVARAIRDMGVYSEIHPHDITVEELKALDNVKTVWLTADRLILTPLCMAAACRLWQLTIPRHSADFAILPFRKRKF